MGPNDVGDHIGRHHMFIMTIGFDFMGNPFFGSMINILYQYIIYSIIYKSQWAIAITLLDTVVCKQI